MRAAVAHNSLIFPSSLENEKDDYDRCLEMPQGSSQTEERERERERERKRDRERKREYMELKMRA
jgi:hypothetical protein